MSKIEASQLNLEKIDFNLRTTIENAVETLSFKAHEKNIAFSVDYEKNLKHMYVGDPNRIGQIVLNLLSNALKFTSQGEIKIVVQSNANSLSGNILISVSDTGMGMAADNLANLFQHFSQVDSSITRKFGGTGLGLAICKQLVGLMQGKIWVTSEEGKGTTFYFTLNLLEANSQSVALADDSRMPTTTKQNVPMSDGNSDLQGFSILLVDDSEDNRILIKAYLKNTKYNITEVDNGKSAYEKVQSGDFDIILMDLQMPIMDGYQATKLIRDWEQQKGINPHFIIALTAYALEEERKKSLAAGCNQHLSKPIKKQTLLDALSSVNKRLQA